METDSNNMHTFDQHYCNTGFPVVCCVFALKKKKNKEEKEGKKIIIIHGAICVYCQCHVVKKNHYHLHFSSGNNNDESRLKYSTAQQSPTETWQPSSSMRRVSQ